MTYSYTSSDRAGVNALIRGIDDLAEAGLPVAVVMCTNRFDAIDPAVRRRAAVIFKFDRPSEVQRLEVLRTGLRGSGIGEDDLAQLALFTGGTKERPLGFTYSDLTQRLIPAIVLDAFPNKPLTGHGAIEVARAMEPTPRFVESPG